MHSKQTLTNHVALVLDRSGSMARQERNLVRAMNRLVGELRDTSERLNQETRITVYTFGSDIDCQIFDMDVFRLPDIGEVYSINGMTALIAAAKRSQDELATTSTLYGDHAFLTFIATDGQENHSRFLGVEAYDLQRTLAAQGPNWSTAWLVPDAGGEEYVRRLGIDKGSIARWDAASAEGVAAMGSKVTEATTRFMENRSKGIVGTRSVFDTSAATVNASTVKAAVSKGDLTPLARGTYVRLQNGADRVQTKPLVLQAGHEYRDGILYYHHVKTEQIQPQKRLVVVEKATGNAYSDPTSEVVTIGGKAHSIGSPKIRRMIGLPEAHVKVPSNFNPDFEIYVQSTAGNRNIIPNQHVLLVP